MAAKTPASAPVPSAPSGPPPPGGDQNRGEDIIITQFVLISIATILVGLRIWVRSRMTRKIGWDDILITIALVSGALLMVDLAFTSYRPWTDF